MEEKRKKTGKKSKSQSFTVANIGLINHTTRSPVEANKYKNIMQSSKKGLVDIQGTFLPSLCALVYSFSYFLTFLFQVCDPYFLTFLITYYSLTYFQKGLVDIQGTISPVYSSHLFLPYFLTHTKAKVFYSFFPP